MSDTQSIFDESINDITKRNVRFATIKAGTGTGKTTTFPCKLCKASFGINKVCVVLPTKEAVYNAYKRADENKIFNVNVTFKVGYAANSIIHYKNDKISYIRNTLYGHPYKVENNDDQLVYCTTGHFKRVIRDCLKYLQNEDYVNPRLLNVFDYVIVDEAHLGTMDISIILGMLKYMLVSFTNKAVPSVICTSATYDEPELYEIKSIATYNVETIYVNTDIDNIISYIAGGLYNILLNILEGGDSPGIVLVFLPGIADIENVKNDLLNEDIHSILEIVIAHSSRNKEQMKDVFTPNSPNKWKVILSTNIAETSLTIPNINIVVDSCLENIRVVGANRTTTNKVQFISKDSAEQRAGRTGRTSNGIVIRMVNKQVFDSFVKSKEPEIERLPITNELLYVLDCNIDVRFIFGDINNGISRSISDNQIKKLNMTLKDLDKLALIKKCSEYYDVTELGKFCAELNIGAKTAVIIHKAIEYGIDAYPVVVFACCLENAETMFKKYIPDEFYSEVPFATIINPWLKMCAKYGHISVSNRLLTNFCHENSLDSDTFLDTHRKILHCLNSLNKAGYNVDIFMFEPEEIFLALKGILDTLYYKYELTANGKDSYMSTNKNIKHKPLYLNKMFIKYDVAPHRIISVLNIQRSGKTQIILWYPDLYINKDNKSTEKLLENVKSSEILQEEEEEEEQEDEEEDI